MNVEPEFSTNFSCVLPAPGPDPIVMFVLGILIGAWLSLVLLTVWSRASILFKEDELQ